MMMLRSKAEQSKKQTNSFSVRNGPGAITAAMYTVAGGKSAWSSFFRVGPPGKFQALKKNKNFKKVSSSQAGGPAQYILTAIPNHRPSI